MIRSLPLTPAITPTRHFPAKGDNAPDADLRALRRDIRRRNFARAQRLSPLEVADMPPDFDPGLEYD